ncbi:homoserine kinase [Candidatus Portiera aleyrodidarum]|uniref:Homoserine kinase n=1 Tax=Candidatus Portiera aleyrodidarum TaxID=91844 RepID=A0A8D9JRN6_9GAMM|nr:homoserine kinase [Candidatus Portiera aleyrodidarum]CEI58870.1 Homoserine kinase [Candidatus Portiera aleyrodidarum]
MAVFTKLKKKQLILFLNSFNIKKIRKFKEVNQGTENSTFFINTENKKFVLTLFEQGEYKDLVFFIDLLKFLYSHCFPVAVPLKDKNNIRIKKLSGKNALLFPKLYGRHPKKPNIEQCSIIGKTLGKLHSISKYFKLKKQNLRDLNWIILNYYKVIFFLNKTDQKLMFNQIYLLKNLVKNLKIPQGILHGDLFRDNTLFYGNNICGLIDFYNGCTGNLLFDLAILINDWCSDKYGKIIEYKYKAILKNYIIERPFTKQELYIWPKMLCLTALRYWISRLLVINIFPGFQKLKPKEPKKYRDILISRCNKHLPSLN